MSEPQAAAGAGARFTEARKALGLTEQDVADALNLSARVIVNLEAEAWDLLPAPAFTRGYIRAYAKLLGISAADMVSAYEDHVGVAKTVELEIPRQAAGRAGVGELVQRQPGPVLSGAVVAVVALAALVLWWVWPRQPVETGAPALEAPVVATAAVGEPESALQPEVAAETERVPQTEKALAAERPAESRPLGSGPTLGPDLVLGAETAPAEGSTGDAAALEPEPRGPERAVAPRPAAQPSTELAQGEPASTPEEPSGAVGSTETRRLTEAGDDRMTLEFSADCWVEVKGASEERLYGDLGRAGETLELVGEAPFRVLVGYAPGVSLSFNGEPVALSGYTRNNVASLWLGRR